MSWTNRCVSFHLMIFSSAVISGMPRVMAVEVGQAATCQVNFRSERGEGDGRFEIGGT